MSTPQKREVRGTDPVRMVLSFEEAGRWGRDPALRSSLEEQAKELGAAEVALETKGGYRLGLLRLEKTAAPPPPAPVEKTPPPVETEEPPRAHAHDEEETASHRGRHEPPPRKHEAAHEVPRRRR